MRVVEKVQQGDLSARAASIPAVGELTGLAQSFDRMANRSSSENPRSRKHANRIRVKRAREARFRAMYDNAAVGMAMMSLDVEKSIELFANQTACSA